MELPDTNQGSNYYLIRSQEIFHEKMEQAQIVLSCMESTSSFNPDVKQELIEVINNDCPYLNQLVLIGGVALVPLMQEEDEIVIGEQWQYSVHVGQHLGVDIIPDQYGKMSLTQKIFAGSYELDNDLSTVSPSFMIYQYFSNNASICFVDDIEEGFNPYYLSEGYDHDRPLRGLSQIVQKSKELSRIFKDTGFRRMNKISQKKIVEDFVDDLSLHSSVNGLNLIIEAEVAHTTELVEEGKILLDIIDVSRSIVSGECLAIDSLERLILSKSRIHSNSTMMVPGAGLFLIIDPDEDTRHGLGLDETQPLHLSISNQNISFEIDS